MSWGKRAFSDNLLGLPYTLKIVLDRTVPAVYVFRHEPTKPDKTDPFEVE